jgi:hypothetical protein
MSLSPTRLMAGGLPYSPTEPICIIFKKIDRISVVMGRELTFAQKITNNTTNNSSSNDAIAILNCGRCRKRMG